MVKDEYLFEKMPEDYEPLPEWALAKANGNYTRIRAALPTKDGRITGNAVVVRLEKMREGIKIYLVVTDAGNVMRMTESEMRERFHPPQLIMKEFLPEHKRAIQRTDRDV